MTRCSTSLVIRKIESKTTMRDYLTPIRMAIINKSTNKCWWGCGEKGTLVHCWWECRLVQPLWKAVSSYLKKIKNGTTLWFNNCSSGNICKETRDTNVKEYMHPYVHCSVIYNSQDMEVTQLPISRWVEKKAVVHLHNGILHNSKKKKSYLLGLHGWIWRVLC